jgi:hypothetical protein
MTADRRWRPWWQTLQLRKCGWATCCERRRPFAAPPEIPWGAPRCMQQAPLSRTEDSLSPVPADGITLMMDARGLDLECRGACACAACGGPCGLAGERAMWGRAQCVCGAFGFNGEPWFFAAAFHADAPGSVCASLAMASGHGVERALREGSRMVWLRCRGAGLPT